MSGSARATVTDLSEVQKRIEVEVPAAEVQSELDRAYEQVRQSAQLRGFRPGHAPRKVLERVYGDRIRQEVTARLVEHSLQHVVEDHALALVATPDVDVAELLVPGEPLRYTATVDVRPVITVGEVAGIELERPAAVVTDDDVEAALAQQRERAAELRPIDDRAVIEAGDVVTVDLTSRLGAEAPQTRQGVLLEAGGGTFPLALERQLVGRRLGEEAAVEVAYPDDYPNPSLAGRQVTFDVRVQALHAKELPPLDDDFARDHGQCESLDELRQRVRADLERQAAQHAEARLRDGALAQLVERHPVPVPPALVARRCDTILATLGLRVPEGPEGEQALVRLREQVRPQAEREVRADLVLDALAARDALEVGDADVDAEIAAMAARERVALERVRAFYERPEAREALRNRLRRSRALEDVVSRAKITTPEHAEVARPEQSR